MSLAPDADFAGQRSPVTAAPDHPLHELDVLLPVEFLVAGGCRECRWRCAMPEGAIWPKCPGCGDQTAPWRTQDFEGSLIDATEEQRAEWRAVAAGYLAFRCNEIDAAEFVSKQVRRRPTEEILAAGGLGPGNLEIEPKAQPGSFGYDS